ncbi:MAG: hypothetical protein ACM3YO_06195 [Bacteroidota bacterium]
MDIREVVIERQDGPEYCGLLFYQHLELSRYVPWTVDLHDPEQMILKLFPPIEEENVSIVCDHYEEMADAIVEMVLARDE